MHKAYRLKHWKDETYISVDFRGNYYFAIPVRMAEIFHTFEEVEKLIDEKKSRSCNRNNILFKQDIWRTF